MAAEGSATGHVIRPGGGCLHCAAARLTFTAEGVGASEPLGPPDAAAHWIMPPLANGHDHARGVRPISLGAFDLPLEMWLAVMTGVPVADPWLVVANALGRQALSGCSAIMVHYTRPQDPARVPQELRVVARAARAIGVRVAIAVAMRDVNALGYAPDESILANLPGEVAAAVRDRLLRAPPPPAEQMRLFQDLAAEIDDPLVDVQFGPYGLEWCSDPLLRLVAERSALTGRRVHMHLLESPIQREYLDAAFPNGPLHYLDEIGLLSPRLSIAHGTQLRPAEMELLAERGVAVSINTSSNLSIRNGLAPAAEMHRRGMRLVTGLDGFSVDDDDDLLRELRLNWMLHRGQGLEDGWPLPALFESATIGGREALGGGRDAAPLTPGATADLLVLRRDAGDVILPAEEPALLAARATRAHVRRLVVAGRDVVRDGRLVSFDLPGAAAELDAQVRAGAAEARAWREVSRRYADGLRAFYAAGLHRQGGP
ncbi:amidohydrolase family protein [Falsiroseomonas oryzae]|uniref:amidohydrolase family protein n=1 Tax=Falsiroseomonas oryzae TaxID=2766473 RepID=UPI0022EA8E48|nr:amidohydrolase family protein [Roseomonas sp. MO-31]